MRLSSKALTSAASVVAAASLAFALAAAPDGSKSKSSRHDDDDRRGRDRGPGFGLALLQRGEHRHHGDGTLSAVGNAKITGTLTLPATCNAPTVMIHLGANAGV